MPYSYVRLSKVLSVKDLLRRWPGAALGEVSALVVASILPAYRRIKKVEDPSGLSTFVCSTNVDFNNFGKVSINLSGSESTVFNLEDVEGVEKEHPEYLWIPTQPEEQEKLDIVISHDASDAQVPSEIELSEWAQAIARTRTSPARTRMEIWLKRIRGEKVSVLEAEYPKRNIQRDVRSARKRDVPFLKQQFPNLPDLEG